MTRLKPDQMGCGKKFTQKKEIETTLKTRRASKALLAYFHKS
jgi:hypothetical protein